jgi:hypothetical protein
METDNFNFNFPPGLYLNRYNHNNVKIYLNLLPEDSVIGDTNIYLNFFNNILRILFNDLNFQYNPSTYLEFIQKLNLDTVFKNLCSNRNIKYNDNDNIAYQNIFNKFINPILINEPIELKFIHVVFFKKNKIFKSIFKSIINSTNNFDLDFITNIENDFLLSLIILETLSDDYNQFNDFFQFNRICSIPYLKAVKHIFEINDNETSISTSLSQFIYDILNNIRFKSQYSINKEYSNIIYNSPNFNEFNKLNLQLNTYLNLNSNDIYDFNNKINEDKFKIQLDKIDKISDLNRDDFYKLCIETYDEFKKCIDNEPKFQDYTNIPINRQVFGDIIFAIWEETNKLEESKIKHSDILRLFDNELFTNPIYTNIKNYFIAVYTNFELLSEFTKITNFNKIFIPSRTTLWFYTESLFCSKLETKINNLCHTVDLKKSKFIKNYKFCIILKELYYFNCKYPFTDLKDSKSFYDFKNSIRDIDTNSLRIDDNESNNIDISSNQIINDSITNNSNNIIENNSAELNNTIIIDNDETNNKKDVNLININKNTKINNTLLNELLLKEKYIYIMQLTNTLIIDKFPIFELKGILIEGTLNNDNVVNELSTKLNNYISYGKLLDITTDKDNSKLFKDDNTENDIKKRIYNINLLSVDLDNTINTELFKISIDYMDNQNISIIDVTIDIINKVDAIIKQYFNIVFSFILLNTIKSINNDDIRIYLTVLSDNSIDTNDTNLLFLYDLNKIIKDITDNLSFKKDDDEDLGFRTKYNITNIGDVGEKIYYDFWNLRINLNDFKKVINRFFKTNKIKEKADEINVIGTNNMIDEFDDDKFISSSDLHTEKVKDY